MGGAADVNKSYFNDEASSYDSKHEKSLQQLTEAIQARLDFIGVDWVKDDKDDSSRPALAPYTTQCVGIDISDNMVAAYNARAENQGLTKDDMFAVAADLAVPDEPDPPSLADPEFSSFDIAAVGGGFHHFSDPDLAAKRIVARLRPGGVLLIWDFLAHEAHHHGASHTVTHHGFSKERIRELFVKAGAGTNYALEELGGGVVFMRGADGEKMRRRVFLARGQKARDASNTPNP